MKNRVDVLCKFDHIFMFLFEKRDYYFLFFFLLNVLNKVYDKYIYLVILIILNQ